MVSHAAEGRTRRGLGPRLGRGRASSPLTGRGSVRTPFGWGTWSAEDLLLVAISVALGAVVLWMGGRSAAGRLALVLAGTVCGVIALGRTGRWPRFGAAELLWALAILWAALLVMALPGFWPAEPLLGGASSASSVRTIAPAASRQALAVLVGCGLFWLALRCCFKTPAQAAAGIRLVAGYTVALAGFGLLQFLFSNGEFFWIYEHPSRSTDGHVCGPFQNQNHLGYCLALGLPCVLWARRFSDPRRRWMWDAGIATLLVAGLLTFSRSAMVLVPIGAALYGLLALRDKRTAWPDRHLLLIALCAGVAIILVGGARIARRLNAAVQADSYSAISPERFDLWAALGRAIAHRPLSGYGPGTHASVYHAFIDRHYPAVFTHAESSFLQVAVEGGCVALVIFLSGLGYLAWIGAGGLRRVAEEADIERATMWRPLVAAFAVAVAHSTVDFAWFIPGCLLPSLVLAATAIALRSGAEQPAPPPAARAVLAGLLLAVGLGAAATLVPPARAAVHWHAYRLASSDGEEDPVPTGDAPQQIATLRCAVQADAGDWRSAERLSLLLIDDLVTRAGSPFQGGAAVQEAWGRSENQRQLAEAVQAAQRALQGNRFAAYAYRTLAIAAAHRRSPGDPEAEGRIAGLIEQSLRVRRHSAPLLITAGEFEVSRGRPQVAFQYWREAWLISVPFRQQLMDQLIPQLPAVLMLSIFQPDGEQLREMARRYAQAEYRQEAAVIADALAEQVQARLQGADPFTAAEALVQQANVEAYASPQRAVDVLRRAVELNPESYEAKRMLAAYLITTGHTSEAVSIVRWCLARRPTDPQVIHLAERLRPEKPRHR